MTRWIDQIPEQVWFKLDKRDKSNMFWIQKQIDQEKKKDWQKFWHDLKKTFTDAP